MIHVAFIGVRLWLFFFFQAEDGIRDVERSRGLGDVYKRQDYKGICPLFNGSCFRFIVFCLP